MAATKQVTILCGENGDKVLVDENVIRWSRTIREMMEDCPEEVWRQGIPYKDISLETMEYIVEFLKYKFSEDMFSEEIEKSHTDMFKQFQELPEWESAFFDKIIKQDMKKMEILLETANFLSIEYLVRTGAMKMASMIHGKNTQEIRELLGIENDLTPEMEEEIKKENAWMLDH